MAAGLRVVLRLLWLILVLGRHALAIIAGLLLPRRLRTSGPQRLRRLLEEIGGTFLKYGQVLALQPDVIPIRYCNALFDLLDRVPAFAYREVERTFYEDLGRPPDEVFDSFDTRPIAAASIGQVHVASSGDQQYAVKVRRPRVEQVFATDLRIMNATAFLIRTLRITSLYWLDRGIREFSSWTWEELDYRYEARFMAAMTYNARDISQEAVPEVRRDLSTSRILVAQLLDGPMVVDYIRTLEHGESKELSQRLQDLDFDPERFARCIIENFVSDAFHNGLFHADLHPANLLILKDNVVGYVDFGITGSLSHYSRRNLVALTLALTRGDIDTILIYFLRIATTDPGSDLPAFRQGLHDLVDDWYERAGDEEHALTSTFTQVMLDMLQLSRRTGVWPTPDVIRYIRSVITADGLITRFAPKLNVGRYLEEVCEEYLRQEMWQEWLSTESLADWTSAGLRLLESGPAALATVLQQLDSSELLIGSQSGISSQHSSSQRSSTRDSSESGSGRRLLQLGAVALISALLTLAEQPQLGWNLFTTELAVSAAAATMVVRNVLWTR